GADAWVTQEQRSRLHEREGGTVDERFMITRTDDSQIVRMRAQILEQVRYLQAGLSISLKGRGRGHQLSLGRLHKLQIEVAGLEAVRQRLAVQSLELGFWVESVEMAGAADHE